MNPETNNLFFFAAHNVRGFSNTWNVWAFPDEDERDAFVQSEAYRENNGNLVQCLAITKREIGKYVDRPRPFYNEARVIDLFQRLSNEETAFLVTIEGTYWGPDSRFIRISDCNRRPN